jgi:hypothetical protein
MIYFLIITYIILIILEILLIKWYTIKNTQISIDNKIIYNNENKDKLKKLFSEKVIKYYKEVTNSSLILENTVNSILKDESVFEVDNYKYYIFIYKKINNSDEFVYYLAHDPKQKFMVIKDIISDKKDILLHLKYDITNDIIKYMLNTGIPGKINTISYYWIDPFTNESVKKTSFYTTFVNKYNEKGVIGIGIDIENLSHKTLSYNYSVINPLLVVVLSLISFIITIILYNISKKVNNTFIQKTKIFMFFLSINLYLGYFLIQKENISTLENENEKNNMINQSILNLSFLTGVNIFIIQSIYKKKPILFKETSLLFGVSIILLLFVNYKPTTGQRIEDVYNDRVTKQLFFNMCIILNIIIILNFIIYSFGSN